MHTLLSVASSAVILVEKGAEKAVTHNTMVRDMAAVLVPPMGIADASQNVHHILTAMVRKVVQKLHVPNHLALKDHTPVKKMVNVVEGPREREKRSRKSSKQKAKKVRKMLT